MRVRIDKDKIAWNTEMIKNRFGGEMVGVSKGVDSNLHVVEALLEGGADVIADSKIDNLREVKHQFGCETMLVRPPGKERLGPALDYADIICHGSKQMVSMQNILSCDLKETTDVILMLDAGDGREGVIPSEWECAIKRVKESRFLNLRQVGINIGCFQKEPTLEQVEAVADDVDEPISIGGSGVLFFLDDLPDQVESVRVGDGPILGKYEHREIPYLLQEAIGIDAEVLVSNQERSVVDIGNVITEPEKLETDADVIKWSNDQLVVDGPYEVGKHIRFDPEYDAMARLFTSSYFRCVQ